MSRDTDLVFETVKWLVQEVATWRNGSPNGSSFRVEGGYEVPLEEVFGELVLRSMGLQLIRECVSICYHRQVSFESGASFWGVFRFNDEAPS